MVEGVVPGLAGRQGGSRRGSRRPQLPVCALPRRAETTKRRLHSTVQLALCNEVAPHNGAFRAPTDLQGRGLPPGPADADVIFR